MSLAPYYLYLKGKNVIQITFVFDYLYFVLVTNRQGTLLFFFCFHILTKHVTFLVFPFLTNHQGSRKKKALQQINL